jgi:superfamily II DNA helicase RecQ
MYEALRLWRLAEVKAGGPAYLIFHDFVLRDIAALRPTTSEELAQIKGEQRCWNAMGGMPWGLAGQLRERLKRG